MARVEGKPAKNPSFWIHSVHFVHTYSKNGPFWFPASTESVTEVRIFGATSLTIRYFDYTPNSTNSAGNGERAAARRSYAMRKIRYPHTSPRRRTRELTNVSFWPRGTAAGLLRHPADLPKPLVQLHGRSLLEHVILGAHEAGIDRFVIVVGYGRRQCASGLPTARLAVSQ